MRFFARKCKYAENVMDKTSRTKGRAGDAFGVFLLLIARPALVVYEYGSEGEERSGLFHSPVLCSGER